MHREEKQGNKNVQQGQERQSRMRSQNQKPPPFSFPTHFLSYSPTRWFEIPSHTSQVHHLHFFRPFFFFIITVFVFLQYQFKWKKKKKKKIIIYSAAEIMKTDVMNLR